MGPSSFRNLTYAAVLLVVGALIYLIYRSSQEKRKARLAQTEIGTGLEALGDTTGSLSMSSSALPSSAALAGDTSINALDGSLSSGSTSSNASIASNGGKTSPAVGDVKDVTVEDPASAAALTKPKGATTATKPKSPATKPPVKFDAGGKGDLMVMAGSFASKDNADALVGKLKKIGFTNAEVVKLENSSNVHVVAGTYEFKGGAEAAVRTLKANKVDAFVKKKSGEVFKATPAPKPAAAVAKPAAKPAVKPS